MTTLCFLWHMHQPFYKDLWSGQYKLPWTRLHALKDYAGMVEILAEFPEVHQTFNLVPSMVTQIEDYAEGKASDPFLDCALARAEDLSEAQRNFIQKYFFQANVDRLIFRYPRYRELYEKKDRFSAQDLRDLQVLNQMVWFDEDLLARDGDLIELIRKGRDYSLDDQAVMARKQHEALQRVLPVYREFAQRGQIEISTTPFYHPILPLLCDSDLGAVSHAGRAMPQRFAYPEDARVQLERARTYMQEKFGVTMRGLWPSEGSVSDHALAIAAECGFRWAASDNGVLGRTLHREAGCDLTYRPYVWKQSGLEMGMLFRDHYLSDLIGFEYSRMSARDAAGHFIDRIKQNAMQVQGREALVPIILDGENAWEWYEANGRPFLRELYGRISEDPELRAATVTEALEAFEPDTLHGIFPGSWINANFDIWIGAEEDNTAWEYLLAARKAFDAAKDVPEHARKLAYEELLIAEGSDWNWWYGPEHGSDNRPEFDQLYRDHLANVYRALGLLPPEALGHPILMTDQPGEFHEPPQNPIQVVLDGEVTSYFEWLGAGRYRADPRQGAMHGGSSPCREMFYGTDDGHLCIRLDGTALDGPGDQVDVEFENGAVTGEIAYGQVVEMRVPRIGTRFRVRISQDGLAPVVIPAQGWIEVGPATALMK
jgi:alpha-amylase/alpha-mannosidase (GH57 family)